MNSFLHIRVDPKAQISISNEAGFRVCLNIKNRDNSEVIKLEMTVDQLLALEDYFQPKKVF